MALANTTIEYPVEFRLPLSKCFNISRRSNSIPPSLLKRLMDLSVACRCKTILLEQAGYQHLKLLRDCDELAQSLEEHIGRRPNKTELQKGKRFMSADSTGL